jgi:hypothetical protein
MVGSIGIDGLMGASIGASSGAGGLGVRGTGGGIRAFGSGSGGSGKVDLAGRGKGTKKIVPGTISSRDRSILDETSSSARAVE